MQFVFILLASVVVTAVSAQSYEYKPSYPAAGYKDDYYSAPAKYDFGYAVKDDYSYVDFGHNENRNGEKTKGQYYVVLPDGRRQVVNYAIDGYSGYVADVKYEGKYKPAYKPIYAHQTEYKPTYHQTTLTPSYIPKH